jgi:hypothetical protein
MITLDGSEVTVLYPGKIYRISYVLKGFFEGIAFTEEDVYEAFENTKKELSEYGLKLSGAGVEDTSSLLGVASFNLYVTVLKALSLDLFNQVFLKYANTAGFPDFFYEVYFVSCQEVSSSPEPIPPPTPWYKEIGSYLKWGVVGLGIYYFGPVLKPALEKTSQKLSKGIERIKKRKK